MITELGLPFVVLLSCAVLLGLGLVLLLAGLLLAAKRGETYLDRRKYLDADGVLREGVFEVRDWGTEYETAKLVGYPRD